jgi:hypothetical protein
LTGCIKKTTRARFSKNSFKSKFQARFINLLAVTILPDILVFCKTKLFSQTNNEKVDVSTRKNNFLKKKVNLWKVMLSNFFIFKKNFDGAKNVRFLRVKPLTSTLPVCLSSQK